MRKFLPYPEPVEGHPRSSGFFEFRVNHCLDVLQGPFFQAVAIDKYGRGAGDTCLFTAIDVSAHLLTGLGARAVTVKGGQVKTKLGGKAFIALSGQGLMVFVEQIVVLPEFPLFMGSNSCLGCGWGLFVKAQGEMFEDDFYGVWILLEHLLE